MTERRMLVVPRDRWARGGDSSLMMDDGSQCCLGHYLSACGIAGERLQGIGTPEELTFVRQLSLPAEASWLLRRDAAVDESRDGDDAVLLMVCNDDRKIDDNAREVRVQQLFANHGVGVTFVDSLPEAS